jgi:hypothetical protein
VKSEPIAIRVTPFICLSCGEIQLKHTEPGNCDRFGCEGDLIETCGPSQLVTVKTLNGTVDKIVAGRARSGS